jgi:predicted Zn-dependent peptidase
MADLDAASVKDVSDFFKTYYAPNNAVLTLVGDFKSNEVLPKIEKYFGSIPAQSAPPSPDMTESKQTAERRKTIEDPLAQIPRIDMAWKIPAGNTPDWYALYVLGEILSSGQSSRFYRTFVREQQVAVQAGAGPMDRRGPALFIVDIAVVPGKDLKQIEKLVDDELERVKTQPVTDAELQKVRMALKRGKVEQLEGTLGRAEDLGENAIFYNDPNLVNTANDKLMAVTKEQIQKVARTYLMDTNRTVVTTIPKPRAGGAQ